MSPTNQLSCNLSNQPTHAIQYQQNAKQMQCFETYCLKLLLYRRGGAGYYSKTVPFGVLLRTPGAGPLRTVSESLATTVGPSAGKSPTKWYSTQLVGLIRTFWTNQPTNWILNECRRLVGDRQV
jgi:hypothetical protein